MAEVVLFHHRIAVAERPGADRVDMNLATPDDQRDHAGHNDAVYVAGHDVLHALDPDPGQSSCAHASSCLGRGHPLVVAQASIRLTRSWFSVVS